MQSKKGSNPSVKTVVKIKNKTNSSVGWLWNEHRKFSISIATGVIKKTVEQYSKKKTGIRYTSKDSMTILPGIDDEYTIDDLT